MYSREPSNGKCGTVVGKPLERILFSFASAFHCECVLTSTCMSFYDTLIMIFHLESCELWMLSRYIAYV